MPRTPSSPRQRSTGRGSGPASTTTAVRGPALRTSASPWPTSHIARCQPGGGQPVNGRTTAAGRSSVTTRTPATATSASGRRAITRTRGTSANVATARAIPPPRPPGQPTVAPGTPAPVRATAAINATGNAATCASRAAALGHTGATSSTRNPSTVAGTTANSASRLHGTATRLTRSVNVTTTGPHTACAAHGTATAAATLAGQPRRANARVQWGARSSSAPVASTDSTKPKLRASPGSTSSRTSAAPASAEGPCRRRPVNSAAKVTSPMTAARSTLGSGRASTTKASTAAAPSSGRARPRTPA